MHQLLRTHSDGACAVQWQKTGSLSTSTCTQAHKLIHFMAMDNRSPCRACREKSLQPLSNKNAQPRQFIYRVGKLFILSAWKMEASVTRLVRVCSPLKNQDGVGNKLQFTVNPDTKMNLRKQPVQQELRHLAIAPWFIVRQAP